MTWMRVDTSLFRHPKLRRLATDLGCTCGGAAGYLVSLWAYAVDFHEDGDLSACRWADIARDIGMTVGHGKSAAVQGERFRVALVAAGFLNSDNTLHDWDEYQGTLLNRRAMDRKRKAEERQRSKEAATSVRRTSSGRPQDIQRPSSGRPDRTNETNERTNGSRDGATPPDDPTFSQPEHQSAYDGYLRAARNPAAVRASIAAVADGMPGHGPGFGWPVVGQALLELAAAGSTFSEQGLRAFARKVRDRKPEAPKPNKVVDHLGRERPAVREGDRWRFTDAEGGTVEVVA